MMKEEPKVYLTRAGKKGEDEEYALENGLAIIGFQEVPSLQGAKDYAAVVKLVRDARPGAKSRAIGNRSSQLWAFVLAIEQGDIVVLPRKLTSQVAIGRVTGPYQYRKVGAAFRHTWAVEWLRPDVPRTAFEQDLLYSFGAFMTVCNISRNDSEQRVMAVLEGKPDPGPSVALEKPLKHSPVTDEVETGTVPDLSQLAHDQIVAHIQARFAGHNLAGLVDAVLRVDGWVTKVSPPGADGGVDILAGRGSLGLDAPRLCVQVKSQNSPADVTVYRTLQGTMQTFKAEQALLVCWGGFNKAVLNESKQGHFTVRLWDSRDLVEAIYRNYEKLPAEIQAELPLKRVWMLVTEEPGE
jgi:restriction system protein